MKAAKLFRATAPVHVRAPETVRRNCPCGRKTPGGEECAECEEKKKKEPLRRSALGTTPATAPPVVGEALRSPSRPLAASARAALEPGFGRDFSGVRIHTDAKAAESAQAVQARAYTVGQDIVFSAGQYDPESYAGLHLLAHELAHVAQGASGASTDESEITVGPRDAFEAEADRAAEAVMSGKAAQVTVGAGVWHLRRLPVGIGVKAHKAIQQNFLIAAGTEVGRRAMERGIPLASFTGQRSQFLCGPEDKSRGFTGGRGYPDLAYLDNQTLELAEIKPEGAECVRMGQAQVQNYLEAAKAATDEATAWRAGLGVTQVALMSEQRYIPRPPLYTQDNTALDVFWVGDGVLVYRSLGHVRVAPGEVTSNSLRTVEGSLRGDPVSLFVLSTRDTVYLSQIPQNAAQLAAIKTKHGLTFQLAKQEAKYLYSFQVLRTEPLITKRGARYTVKLFLNTNPANTNPRFLTSRQTVEGDADVFSPFKLIIEPDQEEIRGTGPLQTGIPLLKKAPLFAVVDGDKFSVVLRGSPKQITPSIPGLSVTTAELAAELIPDLDVTGKLGVAFGPAGKTYADSELKLSADENGFVAEGKVNDHIPGIDQAEGDLAYRSGRLSGSLKLASSQFKLPIPGVTVSRVALTGTFDDKGLVVGGQVDAILSGNTQVTLSAVSKPGGPIAYSGEVTVNVPRLDPVNVKATYDGEHFTGTGLTGFTFRNQRGTFKLHYRDGDVTGTGSLNFKIGKAAGNITVNLSKEHKLSGTGDLTYPLTDKLVGKLGVHIPEEGPVRASGELKVTQPIQLFPVKQGEISFFKFRKTFPIPGLALPVVGGVVVEVSADLGAHYGVGPGTLQDVALTGAVNLSESDPNPEFKGGAKVVVPAFAGLTLSIDGGIGLGNDYVSATGGLNVTGEAGIRGQTDTSVTLAYQDKRFTVNATAAVRAGLYLMLKLKAYVQARAGIGPFETSGRKEWELAGFGWGSGGQVTILLPLHYASDEDFQLPGLQDIKTEPPGLDAQGALKELFGGARTTDKPDK